MLLLLFGVIKGLLVYENAVTRIHKICSLQHELGPRDTKQTTRQIGRLRSRFNKRLGSCCVELHDGTVLGDEF